MTVAEMIQNYLRWMYLPRDESLVPKLMFQVVGPTYEATRQPWMDLEEFLRPLDKAGLVKRVLQDEKKIFLWLPDGECIIEVKSTDKPISILGVGLDFVWVTEAPYIDNDVWYSFIVPMLRSPGRMGCAVVEGRPESEDSYFERLYDMGQAGFPEVQSWHYTTFDNPMVDAEAVLRDASDMPEDTFRKEYLAETLGDSYAAFRNIDNNIKGIYMPQPLKGVVYVVGIDLGKAVDWTALVVGDRVKRSVVEVERFSKIDWVTQKQRITAISKKYNNAVICMDIANVGSPIYDDLRLAGLKILPVNTHSPKEKTRVIDNLALAFEKGTVSIPKSKETELLIGECKLYRKITQSKTGLTLKNPTLRAPYGKHDDCVMALALCVNLFQNTGSMVKIKPKHFGRGF